MKFLSFFLFFPFFVLAGSAAQPETTGAALLTNGDTLYLAAPDKGTIYAFDLKDPARPQQTASFRTGGSPCALDIEGTRMYAADTRELLIFDIAEPGKLKLISRKKLSDDPLNGPADVAVYKGDIHLAMRKSGVMTNFDPRISMYSRALALSGDRLFSAGPLGITAENTGNGGLTIPIYEGTPVRIKIDGPNLYAALGYHGFSVFRDAANLYAAPGDDTGRRFRRTLWHDDGTWDWQNDVALPVSAPGPLGRFAFPETFVYDLAFDTSPARHVFLAAGKSGVITADVSDLSGIRYAASCEELMRHVCLGLALRDKHLYIYEQGFGLHTADARDPLNLKLTGPGLPLR